ncbi:HEAT repeat domain-containing protein [Nonomuraea sp. NPDC050404]|uniref:HEAT repeat domain-containing protein n=1 Tax=Nonomuraea sp. NPDC050404 TaxID=3155783 RepID=UPI0033C7CF19
MAEVFVITPEHIPAAQGALRRPPSGPEDPAAEPDERNTFRVSSIDPFECPPSPPSPLGPLGLLGLRRLIADTDWEHLKVLIGPEEGCPSVPDSLTTLIHGTPTAKARALHSLSEAINHQNSIAEATAPAMIVIAALLADPSTNRVPLPVPPHHADGPASLRAGLLQLMVTVLNDVGQEAEAASRRFGFDLLPEHHQVRTIRPACLPAIQPLLDDPHPEVRESAALAIISLLEDTSLASHRQAMRERAHEILSIGAQPNRYEGCRHDPPF